MSVPIIPALLRQSLAELAADGERLDHTSRMARAQVVHVPLQPARRARGA